MSNTTSLADRLREYEAEIAAFAPKTPDEVEAFRIRFLGSKGLTKTLFAELKTIAPEEKKATGALLNAFRGKAEARYEEAKSLGSPKAASSTEDLSLPGDPVVLGTRHPLRVVEEEIVGIFETLGFGVATGPEIEDDWHNFSSLNMPPDHPARDMQDTFYLHQNPDWVLRTHTSSVQARVLENEAPPVRVVCPGRVYRNETISARAHCFFHQVEGLYIDRDVSFADLKGTLYSFVAQLFGPDVRLRFRPSYFPFTEPSAEMDISCTVCGGSGCSLCKHTGWVEILGCGMVHPQLLRNFGIDPEEHSGFAFGMGVERITQIKYRVNDLRLYSQNDVRFLRQFESISHRS